MVGGAPACEPSKHGLADRMPPSDTFQPGPDSRRRSTSVNTTSGDPKVERLWTRATRKQIQRGACGGRDRHWRTLLHVKGDKAFRPEREWTLPVGFGPIIVLVAWVLIVLALAVLALT
jgi:hypothetical protein